MFKLLSYFNFLLIFLTQYEAKSFKRADLTDNDLKDENQWQGLWFPKPPNYQNHLLNLETVNVASSNEESDNSNSTSWSGLWFPHSPNYQSDSTVQNNNDKKHECDNGKYDLGVDFDPKDKRHSYNYLCLDKRSKYAPNLNTSALIQEYIIPAVYEPPVKCLNETIEYSETLPTFGAYRPLAPKFGTYEYIPPQRWLHSLADGAIVLLFHPCAFSGQVTQLQNTLKGCLYRHIITPTQHLAPQRPLALLAWGKSLQMSVVDDDIVVKFIKDNAKLGFRKKQQNLQLPSKFYESGLLAEAHLVTDEQDLEICGYKEM